MKPKFSLNTPRFYSHAEIADICGLPFRTFQRWSKEIELNLGRARIHEDCLPEIIEKMRLLALQKAKKQTTKPP